MSITPEEKFNHQVWEILQAIKGDYIAAGKNNPIEYEFPRVQGVGIIPKKRRRDIFYKLREWKAIEIIEEISAGLSSGTPLIKYKVKQPKFEEIYQKFQKACDLTTYLNEYQSSQLDGSDLPDFGHIENKKPRQTTKKENRGKMFETGSGGGYYNRNHPTRLTKKLSAKEIVDGFSPSNYSFVLKISEGISSAGEFGSEGEANYKLQSAPGQMLMQERQLLSKFEKLGLFRNLGEDGIFAIAKLRGIDTITLGQIVAEIKSRQTKTSGERGDLKTRYNQLIEEIRNSNKTASGRENLEKRYQKVINEIKSDTATRRGVEKKWDVLQSIWSLYEANSRPDSILVPVARLTIKKRSVELIDGIIDGLQREGAFQKWERKDRYYDIRLINHELLPEIYQEVDDTYHKLARDYQQKNKKKQKKGIDFKELLFSEEESAIINGELNCPLPPYKNEFYLCKIMFGQKIGAPVDWDIVYKEMTGDDNFENKWRVVYDTMRRVNGRFKEVFKTKSQLFNWQNKTIKRNF